MNSPSSSCQVSVSVLSLSLLSNQIFDFQYYYIFFFLVTLSVCVSSCTTFVRSYLSTWAGTCCDFIIWLTNISHVFCETMPKRAHTRIVELKELIRPDDTAEQNFRDLSVGSKGKKIKTQRRTDFRCDALITIYVVQFHNLSLSLSFFPPYSVNVHTSFGERIIISRVGSIKHLCNSVV